MPAKQTEAERQLAALAADVADIRTRLVGLKIPDDDYKMLGQIVTARGKARELKALLPKVPKDKAPPKLHAVAATG